MKVYAAINAVQSDLVKDGIAKDRVNTQGTGYRFRGIDDVYNAVSPLMAKHGLCIIPRMMRRECIERMSNAGKPIFYTTVEAEFDFVSSEDGSNHTARTFGEAMDSGDKSTNKAMSAAYKYACFQTFAIPTEGDNDAESVTHELERTINLSDPRRLSWLAEMAEAISAAKTVGDLKLIHGQAVMYATSNGDADAVHKLDGYAEAKKAQAKAKPQANE